MKLVRLGIALLALCIGTARAQYTDWCHEGSIWILTTPEGANLPATASEADFPLLVRLTRESFDFSQSMAHGEDLRFTDGAGKPLAYQIDEWDTARGVAAIWVRIPRITGNSRQELKLHWGKPDAKGESSGAAVFNESNGYLTVLHMDEAMKDEVGTVAPQDHGTLATAGIVGSARHFEPRKGISCGDKINGLPTGASPHTSQAWIRPGGVNAIAFGWGNERAQGKVTMLLSSPPHIRMDCYFSEADVSSGTVPMGPWLHVVHTYRKGDARIYVNGKLEGVSDRQSTPLALKAPARMSVGGWYNDYHFTGDIDEVRLSSVVRSPDWIRLEYENQKPLQTLVGTLAQAGDKFSTSSNSVTIDEGRQQSIAATAGGAQKVYWVLKRDGVDELVAVDRYSYTLDAGRVMGDTSFVLQFKAAYAGEVKTQDIAVTIRERIPEPAFTLNAPAQWNGRDTIEVVPQISNRSAMQAEGAGLLKYQWTVSGGAVIREVAKDRLILERSQYTGPIKVSVAIDNGGAATFGSCNILVTEPPADAWVQRIAARDERPEDNQFYARDDQNQGTLYCNGVLEKPADQTFLRVFADDKLYKDQTQPVAADRSYAFTVKLKAGLIKYRVEFGTKAGGTETILHTATNLVCGDAYLIEGQSNALATDTAEKSPAETNDWIRSYGSPRGEEKQPHENLWCNPVWKAQLGWWGMQLAKRLVESQNMPIFILNGAVGGTRIDQHQRNEANHTDLGTIYGRMLWRIEQAHLTHGIRAVIWHQGEADQGSDGPDGGYGWQFYQQYFIDMSAAWKQDMPNLQHYYIFQIWPNACSQGGGHGDMLREVQRNLPRMYSHLGIMSTLGIRPGGGCHYPLIGWSEFARLMQPLIERDLYAKAPATSITPPNLLRARHVAGKQAIELEFDQPVAWDDSLASQFCLDDPSAKVTSGTAAGNVLTLKLHQPSAGAKITYLQELHWSQEHVLRGENGIAALTFCDVTIE